MPQPRGPFSLSSFLTFGLSTQDGDPSGPQANIRAHRCSQIDKGLTKLAIDSAHVGIPQLSHYLFLNAASGVTDVLLPLPNQTRRDQDGETRSTKFI